MLTSVSFSVAFVCCTRLLTWPAVLAEADETTRHFGDILDKACAPEPSEATWLNEYQGEGLADEDEDMDDDPADVFGPKAAGISSYDARSRALQLQRDRHDAEQSAVEDAESMLDERFSARSPDLPGYADSSPSRAIEINDRLAVASTGFKSRKRYDQYSEIDVSTCTGLRASLTGR